MLYLGNGLKQREEKKSLISYPKCLKFFKCGG